MFSALAKFAKVAKVACAVAVSSVSTSAQALDALAVPVAKLVAQGGSSALNTTGSGALQAGGMAIAAGDGLFKELVMPNLKQAVTEAMRDASPASWMS
jgi:hypothetical protein